MKKSPFSLIKPACVTIATIVLTLSRMSRSLWNLSGGRPRPPLPLACSIGGRGRPPGLTLTFSTVLVLLALGGCNRFDSRNTAYLYPQWTSHWGFARFGSFDLRLILGNKARFDNPQGVAVLEIEGTDDNIILMVNSGQNIVIHNLPDFRFSKGKHHTPVSLRLAGRNFNQDGNLKIPWGIAAGLHNSVYVVDRGNSRLLKLRYDPSEERLIFERQIGSPGADPGQFHDPRGVAVVGDGVTAVVDNSLGRVTIIDDGGNVKAMWEGLDEPVAIGSSFGSRHGGGDTEENVFVVVIDSLDRRVTKYDLEGNILARTEAIEWKTLLTPELSYLAVDRFGQVLITDRNNGGVHKLTSDLKYLTQFGEKGNGKYQFDQPRGIASNLKTGEIVVAERERVQVLLVGVDVPQFKASVVSDSTWRDLKIEFTTTETAFLDIDLLNEHGVFIARLVEHKEYPPGANHISWGLTIPATLPDGRPVASVPPPCKPGEKLPDGTYRITGKFRATYGSDEVFVRETNAKFEMKW